MIHREASFGVSVKLTSSDTISQVWHALIPPDELKKAVDIEIEKRVQVLMKTGQMSDDDGIRMLDLMLSSSEREPEATKPDRAPRIRERRD